MIESFFAMPARYYVRLAMVTASGQFVASAYISHLVNSGDAKYPKKIVGLLLSPARRKRYINWRRKESVPSALLIHGQQRRLGLSDENDCT